MRGVAGTHLRFTISSGAADAYYDRAADMLVVLGEPLIKRDDLALLGDHNVANALSAALAVMAADSLHQTPRSRGLIADALRSFRALEHRIEPAGLYRGVEWINDSKSTTVATRRKWRCAVCVQPTILLLGRPAQKVEPYTALADALRRNVKLVLRLWARRRPSSRRISPASYRSRSSARISRKCSRVRVTSRRQVTRSAAVARMLQLRHVRQLRGARADLQASRGGTRRRGGRRPEGVTRYCDAPRAGARARSRNRHDACASGGAWVRKHAASSS